MSCANCSATARLPVEHKAFAGTDAIALFGSDLVARQDDVEHARPTRQAVRRPATD
jgi:hypothetical protein